MHAWLLILTLVAAPVGGKDVRGVSSAKAAFERLKELAGDWENTAKKGAGPLRVQHKLTPNGRAVIETFDPGTAREMINVNRSAAWQSFRAILKIQRAVQWQADCL